MHRPSVEPQSAPQYSLGINSLCDSASLAVNTFLRLDPADASELLPVASGPVLIDGKRYEVSAESDTFYKLSDQHPTPRLVRLLAQSPYGEKSDLRIVVGASRPCRVRLAVNNEALISGEFQPSPESDTLALKTLSNDDSDAVPLPDSVACSRTMRLDLSFDPTRGSYNDQSHSELYLLLAERSDGVGSRLKVHADRGYSLSAHIFRFAVYLTFVFGAAAWFLFNESPSLTRGIAPIGLGVIYYLLTTFLPAGALQAWSPGEIVRRGFCKARTTRRRLMLSLLSVLALSLIVLCLAAIGYSTYAKHRFISGIEAALNTTTTGYAEVATAISRLPWRREGFLLYEFKSNDLKRTPKSQKVWHHRVEELVESPQFKQLPQQIASWKSRMLQWFLLRGGRTSVVYQDPIVTMAYIMPEAESSDEFSYKKRAIELLRKHRPEDARAKLLELYIEYDLAAKPESGWQRKTAEVVGDLEIAVDEYIGGWEGSTQTQEYISALDLIAYDKARVAAESCDDAHVEEAVSAMWRSLEEQVGKSTNKERAAWRSPGKLRLAQLWRYVQAQGDPQKDSIYGPYFSEYEPLFTKCPALEKELTNLLSRKEIDSWAKWTVGTALDRPLRGFLLQEVKKDWRI